MDWIENLKKKIDKNILFTHDEELTNYASDYTEDLVHLPQVVAKPTTPNFEAP